MLRRQWSGFAVAALFAGLTVSHPSLADSTTVRIVEPRGLAYLPTYVVVDKHLIENAAAANVGPVRVSLTVLATEQASSEALLADDADVALGGFSSMLQTWDKTLGAEQVKGIVAVASAPIMIVSFDSAIGGLANIAAKDHIAVQNLKTSDAAITLQMAAAMTWGNDSRGRFDANMVPLADSDAMNVIIAGGGEARLHATSVPFSSAEVATGKARVVISSDDVAQAQATSTLAFASKRFHDANPKLYPVIAKAYEDAIAWINDHPHEAADIYVAHEPWKQGSAFIEKIMRDRDGIRFASTPKGMRERAEFMQAGGLLKNKPDSWRDLFWESAAGKSGS